MNIKPTYYLVLWEYFSIDVTQKISDFIKKNNMDYIFCKSMGGEGEHYFEIKAEDLAYIILRNKNDAILLKLKFNNIKICPLLHKTGHKILYSKIKKMFNTGGRMHSITPNTWIMLDDFMENFYNAK